SAQRGPSVEGVAEKNSAPVSLQSSGQSGARSVHRFKAIPMLAWGEGRTGGADALCRRQRLYRGGCGEPGSTEDARRIANPERRGRGVIRRQVSSTQAPTRRDRRFCPGECRG